MVREESEPKLSVTPLNRASKFQKTQDERIIVDIDMLKFKPFDVTFNGREIQLLYNRETGDVIIDGKLYKTDVKEIGRVVKTQIGKDHIYTIEYHEGQIFLEGRLIDFDFHESVPKLTRQKAISSDRELIVAPLPGRVISLSVKLGDKVNQGSKIVTLEAMKMQNDILCHVSGIVTDIYIKEGDQVATHQKLVLIDTEDSL